MTTIIVRLRCPQDNKLCTNSKKCKKDKSKGCAIETMKIWQIKQEEYDPHVPWSARL